MTRFLMIRLSMFALFLSLTFFVCFASADLPCNDTVPVEGYCPGYNGAGDITTPCKGRAKNDCTYYRVTNQEYPKCVNIPNSYGRCETSLTTLTFQCRESKTCYWADEFNECRNLTDLSFQMLENVHFAVNSLCEHED